MNQRHCPSLTKIRENCRRQIAKRVMALKTRLGALQRSPHEKRRPHALWARGYVFRGSAFVDQKNLSLLAFFYQPTSFLSVFRSPPSSCASFSLSFSIIWVEFFTERCLRLGSPILVSTAKVAANGIVFSFCSKFKIPKIQKKFSSCLLFFILTSSFCFS